jgi:hypothetical protein
MTDASALQIVEAQLALARILVPMLLAGSLAAIVLVLGCLYSLCRAASEAGRPPALRSQR